MSKLNSSSSNSKCLVCLSLFKSERCKNPKYFNTVFDVLCRLLEIDSIEPIRWNFNQHGIPFCEVCCPAVERLKKLNDKFEVNKQLINSILHIIKQNILKSGNFSNSSAKDVKVTLINRVHYFHSKITGGSSQLNSNDAEYEDVNPSNIGQFLQVQIESNGDEVQLAYPDRINDKERADNIAISENDPLIEHAKNQRPSDTGRVMEDESFASAIPEASFTESELIIVKPEIIDDYNSDYADTEESSFQDHVMGDIHSNFRDPNAGSRVQPSAGESDSKINTDSNGSTVPKKGVPPSRMKHKCEYCGKILSKRGHLERHMRIHTGEKPYKCDLCGKAFTYSWALVEHARVHTGDKPFKCDLCNKGFTISHTLTKHRRLHSAGKLFQCDYCEKSFVTSKDLKLHRRIHTGKLPNECEVCHMSFPRSWDLTRHKQIHSGEKPYECDICNKAFGRLSNFERHKLIHIKT